MSEEKEISSIGNILGSTFKNGAEYSNTTKTAVFFSFWGDIVGKKYFLNSKPYLFKDNKLFVSCKSSVILQEISLYKKDIIKKANIYGKAVEINIDDIVFSYKNWSELNKKQEDVLEDDNYEIDFHNYTLDDTKIKDMVNKISYLNDEQKQKLVLNIRNNLIKEQMLKH